MLPRSDARIFQSQASIGKETETRRPPADTRPRRPPGPFWLNLSKSGIGRSVGVLSFRVDSGPRGNYVRMWSRSGLLPSDPPAGARAVTTPAGEPSPDSHGPSHVVLHDVTGASVAELETAGRSRLVGQLDAAAQYMRRARIVAILGASLAAALAGVSLILAGVVVVVVIATAIWLHLHEQAKRSVVVSYDVTEAADAFDALVTQFEGLVRSDAVWFTQASGAVKTTSTRSTQEPTIVSRVPARRGEARPTVIDRFRAPRSPVAAACLRRPCRGSRPSRRGVRRRWRRG